jgi:hypothetical protein
MPRPNVYLAASIWQLRLPPWRLPVKARSYHVPVAQRRREELERAQDSTYRKEALKHLACRIHHERQTLYSLEDIVLVPPFSGPSGIRRYMIRR